MMKHLKTLILILSCLIAGCEATMAQRSNDQLPAGSVPSTMNGYLVNKTDTTPITGRQLWLYFGGGLSSRAVLWNDMKVYVASATPVISGVITSFPTVGQTFASLNGFVALFSQTNNPTGSLSGGGSYQRSVTALTHNLSYGYGRTNLNTNSIATAVINPGSHNIFSSSPAQGGTNTGTLSVTTAANTNVTYTLTITTTDSKTATYTTTDAWFGNLYYGRAASTTATSGEILASAGGASPLIGSALSGNIFTVIGSGSPNHLFISLPATIGHITSFKDGAGNDITSLFPETSLSLTNASGYTETYYVYTFSNATSGDFTFKTN